MRRDGYKEAYRMAGIELEVDTVDTVDAVSKELPAPEIFPVGAMPQGCRRLVREAAAAIGCPPEMVAVPMLVTLGTAVGNSRVIRLKQGWDEGATLYAAVVADPGEKKTPAYKVAIEPAINVQAHLREIYRNAEDEYKRELREYEADKRNATKAENPHHHRHSRRSWSGP